MIYILVALLVYCAYRVQIYSEECFYKRNKRLISGKLGKQSDILIKLGLIILIILMGLRDISVGYDTDVYRKNYELLSIGGLGYAYSNELIFQLIMFINSLIFSGEAGFIISMIEYAVIFVLIMHYVSESLSRDTALTMFLFVSLGVYLRGFDQIRQMLALMIFLLGLTYATKKEYKKFTFLWILSLGFHKTAVILLPLYFICKIRLKNWMYLLITLIVVICSFFKDIILKVVCSVLGYSYYDSYLNGTFVEKITMFGYIRLALIAFAFVFCLIATQKYKIINNKTNNMLVNMLFCSVLFCALGVITQMPLIFGRLTFYFVWPLYFLIPEILSSMKNKRIMTLFVILIGIVYLFCATEIRNVYGVSEYKLILD